MDNPVFSVGRTGFENIHNMYEYYTRRPLFTKTITMSLYMYSSKGDSVCDSSVMSHIDEPTPK